MPHNCAAMQSVRAKYMKQLPPEFTDVKESEVQGEASKWVLLAAACCPLVMGVAAQAAARAGIRSGQVQGNARRVVAVLSSVPVEQGCLVAMQCRAWAWMCGATSCLCSAHFSLPALHSLRYEPALRETEADRTNDRRSLQRRLDQRLFMLVKPKGGSWSLMQRGARGGGHSRCSGPLAVVESHA